jgi:hypothetical protein
MGVTGVINGVLFPFRIGVASISFPAPLDAPPNPPEGATHSTLRYAGANPKTRRRSPNF